MVLLLIYIIFGFAFFANLLVDLKIIPPEVTLSTELSVYLLFCASFFITTRKRYSFVFDIVYLYIAFVIVAVSSAILNHCLNINLLVGLRPILRFYVFYIALINLHLSDIQLKKINILIFFLFILQLPASAIRFSYLGISEETIGTYAGHGGGLTPIIPIVALGYLSGFYIFWKPKIIYLILGVGFVLFGIVGAKRVLFFLYPAAFMGIYYIGYIKGKNISPVKFIGVGIFVAVAILSVQLFMMKNISTLNPEQKNNSGSIDYGYVLSYSQKYETSSSYYRPNSGAGRIATTLVAITTVIDAGIGQIIFGFGPGTVLPSLLSADRQVDRRLIPFIASYGKTGFAYILVEYGVVGLILMSSVFLIFMVRSFRWFNFETVPYWKSLSMGTVIFTVLQTWIFFTYNRVPVNDDTIVPVYFYAVSLIHYRFNQIQTIDRVNKIGNKKSIRY